MTNFRPQRFEILPPVIKNLLIINGLLYLTKVTFGQFTELFFDNYLALHSFHSEYFKIYQLITHLFVHANFGHLFFNMFALWMFGAVLENIWNSKRFMTFYLLCGIGASLFHLVYLWFSQKGLIENFSLQIQNLEISQQNFYWQQFTSRVIDIPTVGASGAVFGCLAAFGYLFPNSYLYIYFLLPVKAKWFVLAYIGIELIYLLIENNNGSGDGIARIAHLGGAIIGFLLVFIENKFNKKTFY